MNAVVTGLNIDGDILSPKINTKSVPVLPLRELVAFPELHMPIEVGRETSLKLINEAESKGTALLLVTQKDASVENPKSVDMFTVGVLCKVVRVLNLPNGNNAALVVCYGRARVTEWKNVKGELRAAIEYEDEILPADNDSEMAPLLNAIFEKFSAMLDRMGEENTREVKFALSQYDDMPYRKINFITANSPLPSSEKQALLEISNIKSRCMKLLEKLTYAEELMQLRDDINNRTQARLSNQQREAFLQQQIRTIQDELGEGPDDIEALMERAEQKVWNEETQNHFKRELAKLERYNPSSPEYAVQYTYLDTFLQLPWLNYKLSEISIPKAEKVLNKHHYGLEKVKDRILEYIAVMKLRGDMRSPILCLYGPPGVGKTSLGKSVAEALDRDYARISLGGVHDEAEIRGHRRTYIGAMPGRVISALAKCGSGNPVVVLDEVDKIGADFKGDPSTALLEVLDPEQNGHFHDNFVDADYDLSKVLFIATANTLSTVPAPLLDRMEMVEINGYSSEEKLMIAKQHLVPHLMKDHGFDKGEIKFRQAALTHIIDLYTRESGVRNLEKKIASILRKIARQKAAGETYIKVVTPEVVDELLSKDTRLEPPVEAPDVTGVVTGLAWTPVGGDTLLIETSINESKESKLTLTGQLGDVMKESAVIALQYLRANAQSLGIKDVDFDKVHIHVHVPEGAIPKDGPSAGVSIITAMASALSGRHVKKHLAMTGEITLRGAVLPIGGVKEKLLAARRAGIKTAILPEQNKRDVNQLDAEWIKGMEIEYVDNITSLLDKALV